MSVGMDLVSVSLGYGERVLLQETTLQLRGGELTALMGANGVGKSTLLHALAGLRRPRTGRILVRGADLYALQAIDRARQVAIVLTGRPSVGYLDVRTVVALGRLPWRQLKVEDRSTEAQVLKALDAVGGGHLLGRTMASLSDGECQRVMIARALAQDTPVLLLDEPTAFLDPPGRKAVQQLLASIAHDHGKVVVYSTHDVQAALQCERLLLFTPNGLELMDTATALATGGLERTFPNGGYP